MTTTKSSSVVWSEAELKAFIKTRVEEKSGKKVKSIEFKCGTRSTCFMYADNEITGYLDSVQIDFEDESVDL